MNLKKYLVGFLALTFVLTANAAKIEDDVLKLGKPGSSANKEIQMGAGRVRMNVASGKMQTSSDSGASYKNIGSGSGGAAGVNLIGDSNPDFESALTGTWTASGGAASQVTAGSNVLFGAGSLLFNSSASSQSVSSNAFAIPNGLLNNNGLAFCKFKTAATDYKLQVVQVSTVIAENIIPAISGTEAVYVPFVFPGSGNIFMRIISQSDAADLAADDCFLGSSDSKEFSQATFLGRAVFSVANNCAWLTSSISFGDFSADSDCNFPTVSGKAQAAGTKIPAIVFPSIPKGNLKCEATGSFVKQGSSNQASFRFSDGTNFSSPNSFTENTMAGGALVIQSVIGSIDYATSQSNVTIQIQGKNSNGTDNVTLQNSDTSIPETLDISCWSYPSESSQVQRVNDQPSYAIAKTIDTAALNANTSSLTYVTLADAAFASGTKSYLGSAGVCATPNNLCAKAGKLKQGVYDVSLNAVFYANQLSTCSFKVVANGQDIGEFFVNSTAAGAPQYGGVLKGYYVAVNEEANIEFSLQSKLQTGGTSCGVATDSANAGGHILFEIRPSAMTIADYLLKNSWQSPSGTQENIVRIYYGTGSLGTDCSASPCTFIRSNLAGVSVTRSGAGVYQAVFPAGYLQNSSMTCHLQMNSTSAGNLAVMNLATSTNTTVDFISYVASSGTPTDSNGVLECKSNKP